jgi:hypothetical protein
MSRKEGETFAGKHAAKGVKADERISAAIREKAVDGEISCSNATGIATEMNAGMAVVGMNADLLELRIVRCQLGLFGYKPEMRIVKAAASVAPQLEGAIRGALIGGRLPCVAAWGIAEAQQLPRMEVASACEALGIKVKPCQLGAF